MLERLVPEPLEVDHSGRLSTRFLEWMMGLPDGWVTDPRLGVSYSAQQMMLGNGVVPQQAEFALRVLLDSW